MRRTPALPALGFAAILALSACQATPEKIATWKGTQRGPQKLAEVVKDAQADPHLRALAIAALVEIGLAQDATRALAGTDPATRTRIAHELVAPLTTLLGDSIDKAAPTTQVQRAAKDALFVARGDAEPADRARIDPVLIKWTEIDLIARSAQGGEATEKILRAIGPLAAGPLVALVHPGPDLLLAARLIGELGDRETKTRAVAPLAALIRGGAGGPRAAPEQLLQALGLVGGAEATALLLEIAGSGQAQVRQKALYALAQGQLSAGDDKALAGSLAIAGDGRAPGEVREAAFQVAEKLGPGAVGGLTAFFTDHDSVVRFRAVEAALKAGGAGAVTRVLAALPEDRPIKSEDLDSFVVHDLTLIGKEAIAPLSACAKNSGARALGRVAAIRALARIGGPDSVAALSASKGETTPVKALTPAASLADEIARATKAASGKR